ncbi:MAG: pitrilysin family protein [Planctomycetota bacterium]|nr:pitrilysin family protein [Planctomycetota bacterium]MDG2142587.1 pitrilysin family protein [Planctomycetota bacterium]
MLPISSVTLALALSYTAAAPSGLPIQEPVGQGEAAPLTGVAKLQASVTEHTLDNGWTFLIVPREGAPVASFHTYIDVGGVFEDDGATGMAHMFEHMAFKGSARLGSLDWEEEELALDKLEKAYLRLRRMRKTGREGAIAKAKQTFLVAQKKAASLVDAEAFSKILEEAGGSSSLNASTSAEETRYVVSLPSNQIELWCWMERERFHEPVLREFYKERDAVMEERRMRVESSPFGKLIEELLAKAFTTHPYRRPVIGYEADLNNFSRTDAQAFYAKHYGVRRFTTAIVGDVDPITLVPLLERYFSDLAAGPEPTEVDVTEPKQDAERRVDVTFPAMPIVMAAWHVPSRSHPDSVALNLGLSILGQASASRLETSLVRGSGQAADAGADGGLPGDRYPNLAFVYGIPTEDTPIEELEAGIYQVMDTFTREGPTPAELAGAKNRARASLLRGLQDNEALAADLCEWQSKSGDWRNLFGQPSALAEVTANDIQRVFARYFTQQARTVATLVPAKPE